MHWSASIILTVVLWQPLLSFAEAPAVPAAADISVNGVFLYDVESQRRVLGAEIPFDRQFGLGVATFGSKDGSQLLTIFTHPGGIGDIAEFRIARARRGARAIRNIDNIESFATGKGIRLGLSEAEVTSILGLPLRDHSKGKFRTIEYRIEDARAKSSQFLSQYNMPIYYGVYTFSNDQLVALQFGFEYP